MINIRNSICPELCLKLWFENDWYFCNIIESGWYWIRLTRKKFQTRTSQSQFEKVTIQKSIAELWTVISHQMIKHQLPHRLFHQLNDHKLDIYLYRKLSTTLLALATNKNTSSYLRKLDGCFFLQSFMTEAAII